MCNDKDCGGYEGFRPYRMRGWIRFYQAMLIENKKVRVSKIDPDTFTTLQTYDQGWIFKKNIRHWHIYHDDPYRMPGAPGPGARFGTMEFIRIAPE